MPVACHNPTFTEMLSGSGGPAEANKDSSGNGTGAGTGSGRGSSVPLEGLETKATNKKKTQQKTKKNTSKKGALFGGAKLDLQVRFSQLRQGQWPRWREDKMHCCKCTWHHGRQCQLAHWRDHKADCLKCRVELEALAAEAEDSACGISCGSNVGSTSGGQVDNDNIVKWILPYGENGHQQHESLVAHPRTMSRKRSAKAQQSLLGSRQQGVQPENVVLVGKEGNNSKVDDGGMCALCLNTLEDPISPCPVPQHQYCRLCVQGMREHGVNDACPQCRATMKDEHELFAASVQLLVQCTRLTHDPTVA